MEKLKNLKLIKEIQSKYALIKLYRTEEGKLMLCLDTFIQFVEGEDEEIYHKNLTRHSFDSNSKNFLILGGGDGFVSREIFKYDVNANIDLVDIDEEMIRLSLFNKDLLKLNKGSMHFTRKYISNAFYWVKNCEKKYDSIIVDFPDANSEELKKLYTKEMYENIIKLLNKNGTVSIQAHDDIVDSVSKNIKEILGNAKVYKHKMPFLGEGNVVVGKNEFNL